MKIRLFTIPNLLTLSNLLCGSFAAVSALVYGDLRTAFLLVIAAAVFDFFDGFAARLLRCQSPIGVELDSLADMVSFGFAPAAVLFAMYLSSEPNWNWSGWSLSWAGCFVFVVAAFAALRLAKFNIDETQHTEFCGLPSPAGALFCTSLGWLSARGVLQMSSEAILLAAAVVAWLMIARIRMFSFKFQGFGWRGNGLRYGFLLAAVVLLLWMGLGAVPLIIMGYVLVSALRNLLGRTSA